MLLNRHNDVRRTAARIVGNSWRGTGCVRASLSRHSDAHSRRSLARILQNESILPGQAGLIDHAWLRIALPHRLSHRASDHESQIRHKLGHRPLLVFRPLFTAGSLAHRAGTGHLGELGEAVPAVAKRDRHTSALPGVARGRRVGGYLLKLRTPFIHHQIVAGKIRGGAMEDQMKSFDEQILEHLPELFLRSIGRHSRSHVVPNPRRKNPLHSGALELIETQAERTLEQRTHNGVRSVETPRIVGAGPAGDRVRRTRIAVSHLDGGGIECGAFGKAPARQDNTSQEDE